MNEITPDFKANAYHSFFRVFFAGGRNA
jgi:hypothetical protein